MSFDVQKIISSTASTYCVRLLNVRKLVFSRVFVSCCLLWKTQLKFSLNIVPDVPWYRATLLTMFKTEHMTAGEARNFSFFQVSGKTGSKREGVRQLSFLCWRQWGNWHFLSPCTNSTLSANKTNVSWIFKNDKCYMCTWNFFVGYKCLLANNSRVRACKIYVHS